MVMGEEKRTQQKRLEGHQEFDKNLPHNIQKITELTEQNKKIYEAFISKVSARLNSKTRPAFEASELRFNELIDSFLLSKYGAINSKANPLRGICYIQDVESFRAHRIKFLGELIEPTTGSLSPCHQKELKIIKENEMALKKATQLSDISKSTLLPHKDFFTYLEESKKFLNLIMPTHQKSCELYQENIVMNFYETQLQEWSQQSKDKHLCLQ